MNDYIEHSEAMERRATFNYFVRLESESSLASEEGSESATSIQDRETEYVEDTADTGSDVTDDEFEVASLSEAETAEIQDLCSSSGTDEIYIRAEDVIAAALGDTSLEAWAPDGGEDSYSSSTDVENFGTTDFGTCALCKSENKNPRFRFCEKCFQVRKNFNPPRPKRCKKRKTQSNKERVNVDNLRTCLNGLSSQDSGLGSSQEFPSLDFKGIKVPEQHLSKCSSSSSSSGIATDTGNTSSGGSTSAERTSDSGCVTNRKRKSSDNSSDNDLPPKKIIIEGPLNSENKIATSLDDKTNLEEEQCITCASNKKDGIFLHGSSAHSCCCYKCAIKTWKTTNRCPICKRRITNVVKLFM